MILFKNLEILKVKTAITFPYVHYSMHIICTYARVFVVFIQHTLTRRTDDRLVLVCVDGMGIGWVQRSSSEESDSKYWAKIRTINQTRSIWHSQLGDAILKLTKMTTSRTISSCPLLLISPLGLFVFSQFHSIQFSIRTNGKHMFATLSRR